jgi:hypothetical protein
MEWLRKITRHLTAVVISKKKELWLPPSSGVFVHVYYEEENAEQYKLTIVAPH